MRFAGLKMLLRSIFNFNLKLAEVALSWRYHGAIMAVGGEDERKK
jgi:hypothetical protein